MESFNHDIFGCTVDIHGIISRHVETILLMTKIHNGRLKKPCFKGFLQSGAITFMFTEVLFSTQKSAGETEIVNSCGSYFAFGQVVDTILLFGRLWN